MGQKYIFQNLASVQSDLLLFLRLTQKAETGFYLRVLFSRFLVLVSDMIQSAIREKAMTVRKRKIKNVQPTSGMR